MEDFVYLHIPKTAGTALKVLAKEGKRPFKTAHSHDIRIQDRDRVIFGVRNPWERFCSGFWEAKTLPLRYELSQKKEHTKYRMGSYDKLTQLPEWYEKTVECATPDEFCSLLKTNADLVIQLYDFTKSSYKSHTTLGIATQSLTWWLGNLSEYKTNENKVAYAIDVKSIGKFISNYYGFQMPKDPFQSRSRAQFEIEQSYKCSNENLDWFSNHFRKEDYELIEYIKTQPYYYNN
jgi:hypothetical protein